LGGIGERLSELRKKCGLSLREVQDRSLRLAEGWGNPSCRISASWLARVEHGGRDLSASKLIVLAAIFRIPAEQLLALGTLRSDDIPPNGHLPTSKTTLLQTSGALADQACSFLPEEFMSQPVPEKTTLLSRENYLSSAYRYGIIGRHDNPLAPLIRNGSFLFINTQKRTITGRREWTNEFDRPVYFVMTHAGYSCGWYDLDKKAEWITMIPHPLSYASATRLRYRKEVEVIGQVVAVFQRFEQLSQPS
jgi:transcriptional regulator with XRE-family HTH domain